MGLNEGFSPVNLSRDASTYQWDFGDGTESLAFEPAHAYSQSDSFTITLVAYNGICSDTQSGACS